MARETNCSVCYGKGTFIGGSGRAETCGGCNGTGKGIDYSHNHNSSDGCFPKGTKIKTAEGQIDISLIRAGDSVCSFDDRQNVLVTKRVLKVRKHKQQKIWKIGFTDGHQIRTTAIHSFRVQGKWKKARDIEKGDIMLCINSKGKFISRSVSHSNLSNDAEDVFNLIVEGPFTFIANGSIANSFSYFRGFRKLAWTFYLKPKEFFKIRLLTKISIWLKIQNRPVCF